MVYIHTARLLTVTLPVNWPFEPMAAVPWAVPIVIATVSPAVGYTGPAAEMVPVNWMVDVPTFTDCEGVRLVIDGVALLTVWLSRAEVLPAKSEVAP